MKCSTSKKTPNEGKLSMSITLKKPYALIAGILVSMVGQVNAAYQAEQDEEEPHCGPPTCRPSPYYGTNCMPDPYCQEVNLRGEALYWTASLGGLEAAFGRTAIDTTVAGGITTTTVTETDRAPHWEWRPGFRVGADYAFLCFDLESDWTHYNGHAHFHNNGQHGHWRITYDAIDLLFGRRFSIAPCFYFKPFIGVRAARIHQRLSSHLNTQFTSIIGDNTVTTIKNDKEKFWGVGPELGIEADWYMGANFSLYASFDFVTYYGKVRTRTHNTDTFTSTVSASNGKIRRDFNSIATDGSVGIRWDKAWSVASEVLLTIKLGVEQHRIYDFSDLGSDGTLSMDGANLALSMGYRW